ncbi:unnamed protein product [Rotaria sp. Silwood2]|nr:unnamed protein product [Rotaria sp. Silwood2]CAF4183664.1 unnamed protein product [Rotaria sp. Silwood2]
MTSSSSSKTTCTSDQCKSVGIFKCGVCSQIFCRKHVNEHRNLLSHQLDEIDLEHDILHQMILEEKNKEKHYDPLLKEVDKWERDSIRKIQQTANEARQQVKILFGSQNDRISKGLHDLTEQLRKIRIDDNFVEIDLHKWTNMLEKLQRDVTNATPLTTISEDPTKLVVAKIFVSSTMQQHLEQDERFEKFFGDIFIAENGHLAYHCGLKRSYAFVRGMQEYSSGKYKIRFIMKKENPILVMSFNIISKSRSIPTTQSYLEKSGYGWFSDDCICCCNGVLLSDKNFYDIQGQTTIEIELLIDCDNQKISYFNERTKNRRELNVDIKKCPFPWQLLFYLYDVEDSVRLLSLTRLR